MLRRREFIQLGAMALAASAVLDVRVIAQRPLPKSEFDYVDWSWQRWREITKQVRPKIKGAQTGLAELIDLLMLGEEKITTAAQWEARRAATLKVVFEILGTPPREKPALSPEVIEETSHEGYNRRKVTFQGQPGERIPAYILIPKDNTERRPAVICPHQTTQEGKKEPAGIAGNPELQTALHLVSRGYVTITYDALCFGQRHDPASGHYGDAIPFYKQHPNWSLIGKMVWDLQRVIDYLQTLDFVNPERIGSVGHSHGGVTTLFAMALDKRIKVGASNCGFDTFRIDGNVWRWSHATALMPRLGFYVGSPYINMDFYRGVPDSEVIQTPFDMHELLSLIAPRPLFLSTSDEDFVFPNAGWSARRALALLGPVYSLLKEPVKLEGHFFKGGHSFPKEVSRRAYEWLDRWL